MLEAIDSCFEIFTHQHGIANKQAQVPTGDDDQKTI